MFRMRRHVGGVRQSSSRASGTAERGRLTLQRHRLLLLLLLRIWQPLVHLTLLRGDQYVAAVWCGDGVSAVRRHYSQVVCIFVGSSISGMELLLILQLLEVNGLLVLLLLIGELLLLLL